MSFAAPFGLATGALGVVSGVAGGRIEGGERAWEVMWGVGVTVIGALSERVWWGLFRCIKLVQPSRAVVWADATI